MTAELFEPRTVAPEATGSVSVPPGPPPLPAETDLEPGETLEEVLVETGPECFEGILGDLGPDAPGSLTKSGASTLILTTDHVHTGGTMVAGGTLQLGDDGETGSVPGPITVHGLLVFARSNEVDFAGVIHGAGRVVQRGAGRLRLSGRSPARGVLEIGGGGAAVSGSWAGTVEVSPDRILTLESGSVGAYGASSTIAAEAAAEGSGLIRGGLINYGTLAVEGAWSVLTVRGGPVTNAAGGVLRATRGAILNLSGATLLVNQGLIDRISGTVLFPDAFRNLGLIVDSSMIRVKSAARNGDTVALSIDSYTGHTYQLQRGRSLAPEDFVSIGKPKPGQTGRDLRFIDPFPDLTAGYYRVVVDP